MCYALLWSYDCALYLYVWSMGDDLVDLAEAEPGHSATHEALLYAAYGEETPTFLKGVHT